MHKRTLGLATLVASISGVVALVDQLPEDPLESAARPVEEEGRAIGDSVGSAISPTENVSSAPLEQAREVTQGDEENDRDRSLSQDLEEDAARTQRILALPGVEAFEVAPSGTWQRVASTLASEGRDPTWSAEMEANIVSELSQVAGLEAFTIHVECRTTMCGVLFVYPDDPELITRYVEIKDTLGEAFGFSGRMSFGRPGENGIRFTSLYLQGGRTSTTQSTSDAPSTV